MKRCALLMALILMLAGMAGAQAEILPPYGEGQIGLSSEVLCESLTLREEPRSSARAIATVPYGDMIIVMEQRDGWAYCTLSDTVDEDRIGWVNADYLAIDPARYRTEKQTPVYAWDSTSAKKVALLDKNTTLPIVTQMGDWLVVSLRGATGWIYIG